MVQYIYSSPIAKIANKLSPPVWAITIGQKIHFLLSEGECLNHKAFATWCKHERAHALQWEMYGPKFALMYLWETKKNGYDNNKYEIEARAAERR